MPYNNQLNSHTNTSRLVLTFIYTSYRAFFLLNFFRCLNKIRKKNLFPSRNVQNTKHLWKVLRAIEKSWIFERKKNMQNTSDWEGCWTFVNIKKSKTLDFFCINRNESQMEPMNTSNCWMQKKMIISDRKYWWRRRERML